MSKKCIILFLSLIHFIPVSSQNANNTLYAKKNGNSKVMKLTNGNWFNGETFEEKTIWIKDGLIHFKEIKETIDTTLNLSGNYVIPAFGEAHNHNLENDYGLEQRISSYLTNGVFYVKLPSTIKKGIQPLMHHYNKPSGIDISMAMAPLTATGGHPIRLRQYFLEQGYFDDLFTSIEEIEFHGYVKLDNLEDLHQKWEKVLSFDPDFIKINLLYSEEYEKRKNDTLFFGRKGLNPELLPEIVKRAHKADLRVTAHVETAHDFRVAVSSRVDEIAHLPEISNGKLIDDKDAMLAKENGVVVVTTASLVLKRKDRPDYAHLKRNIAANLKKLKDAGVTLAIGSDMYNDNSTGEFRFLHQLEVFTNLELLKMWTENATKTIFPHRKIGYLKEGYEASFLVLNKNPLEDIAEVNENIILRVKQGVILN